MAWGHPTSEIADEGFSKDGGSVVPVGTAVGERSMDSMDGMDFMDVGSFVRSMGGVSRTPRRRTTKAPAR